MVAKAVAARVGARVAKAAVATAEAASAVARVVTMARDKCLRASHRIESKSEWQKAVRCARLCLPNYS